MHSTALSFAVSGDKASVHLSMSQKCILHLSIVQGLIRTRIFEVPKTGKLNVSQIDVCIRRTPLYGESSISDQDGKTAKTVISMTTNKADSESQHACDACNDENGVDDYVAEKQEHRAGDDVAVMLRGTWRW